jgi:hypothetical protein
MAFDIDPLLRGDRRAETGDIAQTRAEVGRALLTASGHSGVAPEDRAYPARLVAARTGTAPSEEERRVDAAIPGPTSHGRFESSVILDFMAGAAALLGAVAAWGFMKSPGEDYPGAATHP